LEAVLLREDSLDSLGLRASLLSKIYDNRTL